MPDLPAKIRQLDVLVGGGVEGSLVRDSTYGLTYAKDDLSAPAIGLFMPRTAMSYSDGALFPVMDQNLPEGYLFQRLVEMFPKQPLTDMHLLALTGANGIGRLGFRQSGSQTAKLQSVSRNTLLRSKPDDNLFTSVSGPQEYDEDLPTSGRASAIWGVGVWCQKSAKNRRPHRASDVRDHE